MHGGRTTIQTMRNRMTTAVDGSTNRVSDSDDLAAGIMGCVNTKPSRNNKYRRRHRKTSTNEKVIYLATTSANRKQFTHVGPCHCSPHSSSLRCCGNIFPSVFCASILFFPANCHFPDVRTKTTQMAHGRTGGNSAMQPGHTMRMLLFLTSFVISGGNRASRTRLHGTECGNSVSDIIHKLTHSSEQRKKHDEVECSKFSCLSLFGTPMAIVDQVSSSCNHRQYDKQIILTQ